MYLMAFFVEYNHVFEVYQSYIKKFHFDWDVYNIMFAHCTYGYAHVGSYNHTYDKSKELRH